MKLLEGVYKATDNFYQILKVGSRMLNIKLDNKCDISR